MHFYKISWILYFALCQIIISIAYGSTNLDQTPSAMIIGTVYCDTCFHQNSSRKNQIISGASVSVDCSNKTTKSNFTKTVTTDKFGVFRVKLPSEIGKHIKKIKECSVILISSNNPFCAVAASATSNSLNLKFIKNKVHVFSSGFFTFRPLKQPELCYQKPSVDVSSSLVVSVDVSPSSPLPSLNIPPFPLLPPLPNLPNLPPFPNLPNFPLLPPPASPVVPGIPKETKT